MSPNRAPTADAVSRSRDVIEILTSTIANKMLKDELLQILVSPHIQVRNENNIGQDSIRPIPISGNI